MESLLVRYGYALLFLGVAAEGEAFLLTASCLAQRGIFSLPMVIAVAVLANFAADQVYFLMARARGRAWLERRFGAHPRYERLISLTSRRGSALLLVSRFAFGFRIIIPAACGALGMPLRRFTLINLAAGLLWAVPTGILGFYFGEAAASLFTGFQRYEYRLLPIFLAAAAAVLLVRHVRRSQWIEDLTLSDAHMLVPMLIGVMGAVNVVNAIWPRSRDALHGLESWLPLQVTQPSRALMLFSGIALIQVTRNLRRRKELAWWVATVALAISLLLHMTRGLDLHHSLVAGLLLFYLVSYRRRFYARSDPASIRLGLLTAPVLMAAVMAYGSVGLRHMEHQFAWQPGTRAAAEAFRAGILIQEPHLKPGNARAQHFLASLEIAGWLARFYLLALLLRPVILRDRQEAPAARVREIFDRHGRRSLSAFAVQSDKHHHLVAGGRGLVSFATYGSIALACGDPLAADEDFPSCIGEYLDHCRKNGWTPCLYEAAEDRLAAYNALGLRALKIAEEALIDLREFSLAGNKRANLRAMVNKAIKEGLAVRRYDRAAQPDPALDGRLERISQEWLSEKRLGELGFTVGRFSIESLNGIPVFAATCCDRVEAFCTWLPYRGGEARVLDLMRKRNDAPSGVMDLLLADSLAQLRQEGIAEASLGNAPLANVGDPKGPLEHGVALLFENLNAYYGYKNLFRFKKKFAPRWEGRYLVYPKGADLPKIAYAVAGLHGPGGLLRLLLGR